MKTQSAKYPHQHFVSCVCSLEYREEEKERQREEEKEREGVQKKMHRSVGELLSIDGAAAVKVSAPLQNIKQLCFKVYSYRDGLSVALV